MLQINRIKRHSPQEGKNKWLILFSASIASSVPRSDWEGGGGVVLRGFPELALWDCRTKECPDIIYEYNSRLISDPIVCVYLLYIVTWGIVTLYGAHFYVSMMCRTSLSPR